jgi:hypothetical protein
MASLASPDLRVAAGQLTLAEVNAGKVVVPAVVKRAYTVVDCWLRAIGGAAANNTSVDVQDSVSATKVAVFTRAGLTENALARAGVAVTSVATNLNTSLGRGEGIRILNVGTACDTMVSLDYVILYKVEAVDQV